MDFTHTAYFPGAQPYQFIGIPPLTPSHSNSVASEDFNTTSPPEVYEQFPNGIAHEPFQNFDSYAVQFNAQQPFPGPPTPPGPHPAAAVQQQPTNGAVPPPMPIPGDVTPATKIENEEQARRQGSNSDEDELTPAQSRRKAQNRAAQRAFRERKERHVKDLENRLQQLEQSQQQTVTENEKLKRDLQKMSTENEILRATSIAGAGSPAVTAPTTTGPMSYQPTDFYSNVLQGHANKTPSHRIVTSDDGERLLAAGATWDLIINHELFKRGMVDIAQVSEQLRPQAKCDGQGPVFEERAILEAIEMSVASGRDELL
ncbi:fluconazole resistance protein 3 [Echria macrotheca]|uniref:Fluconazole resistance protein 3 n=1 Tax=Echria macrotheca TaxID=438768 RepID=A0AAJ0BHL0_9PEZI|nr:fluconazole resistance protein 3 [Echria macrotheca]